MALQTDRHRPPDRHPIGHAVLVKGSQAGIRLVAGGGHDPVTVGRFVGLETGGSIVIGVVTSVTADPSGAPGREPTCAMDVMGEIRADGAGRSAYYRGVSDYPAIGDPAVALTNADLRLVFDNPGAAAIRIGHLHQDPSIGAHVKVDEMLNKHFAVLGSTGAGKSSGVSVIIGEVLDAKPDLRIFFIDPHNEYGTCFGDRAEVLTPRNLRLPFWLFNFEEIVDVVFRGRPGLEEETEILADVIPQAKAMAVAGKLALDRSPVRRSDARSTGFHVDTPVPYRLADLASLIEDRRGKLDNRAYAGHYNRLLSRIETVRNDPRYGFMFDNANVGGDTMADVLAQLFRLTPDGRPMTVMQLAGFPAEVVDSVVSVLCRMAFDFGLWSDGAVPILLVCEEAHRYAPADRSVGFGPTRKAISRIAKEGRKYGVCLGLVTQRPAELDSTIVSQCNTVFAMRMANDRDQAILRSAVSDAAATLLGFVPSLATREVFAFGEGLALPTRFRFNDLPPERIPRSEAVHLARLAKGSLDRAFLTTVVERWRGATAGRAVPDDAAVIPAAPARPGAVAAQAGDPGYPGLRPSPPPMLRDATLRGFGGRSSP